MLDETVFSGSRLCIVGNVCRDVRTAPIDPAPHLFEDGETPTEFIVETVGGGGANSALAAAALGAEVRFAGKTGDDPLGTRLQQALGQRGVRSFLRRDPQTPTGSSVALGFTSGCRHFLCCQPNNDSLRFDDIDLSMLADGQHLLRADVWFSDSMLAEGNARLFQAARDAGLATSLDVNWDPRWGSADESLVHARKEAVRRVLPLVDLVHGNVRELNRFADSTDLPTTLGRLTAWGVGAVVVHLGSEGAGYYCRGNWVVEPCTAVSRLVNTTGTGDLLSVCIILMHRRPEIAVREKLRLANRIVAEYIEGRRDFGGRC